VRRSVMAEPKPWEEKVEGFHSDRPGEGERSYFACMVYCKTEADWNRLLDLMEPLRSQYDWEELEEFRIEKGTPFSADLD
jgi:hypothetical protein